jgi:hypothetical protein
MSEDRLKYIEIIGEAPSASAIGEEREEAQRAAFQAARRQAEALAEEAGVRLTGILQIGEISGTGDFGRADRVRFRVRFGIEPAHSPGGRAGFREAD